MPTYSYTCENCNHTFDKLTKIDDRFIPESSPCPACNTENSVKFCISAPPGLTDSFSLGRIKPDSDFREILKTAKKSAGSLENMGSSHV